MQANTVRLNPIQHTLDQIAFEALSILRALGLEMNEDMALKDRVLPSVDLDSLGQKVQFLEGDLVVFWK